MVGETAAETGRDGDGISKFIEREEEEEDILTFFASWPFSCGGGRG
jgi:hypothetical protein